MLNRALRAQDIDILYKFRFFIKDLHEQIQQLHMRHVESMETNVLTVYRGTRMTIDELDQFKKTIGCFLSIYQFLSTSSEQKIALGFALQHLHRPNIEAVILEIKINVQECKTPFANIENFSEYDMEKEILFSLGTIYRLESIEKLTNGIWNLKLILCDEGDPKLAHLTDCIREEVGGTKELINLAGLMEQMGRFNEAKEFYQILLNDSTFHGNEPCHLSDLYCHLGYVCYRVASIAADIRMAFDYYRRALEIDEKYRPNEQSVVSLYENLGKLYLDQKMYEEALIHFLRALEIETHSPSPRPQRVGALYTRIGSVYSAQNKFTVAIKFYSEALEIQEIILPSIHPDIADTYEEMAVTMFKQGENYKNAFIYLRKSIEISLKSLPDNHQLISQRREGLELIRKML
ncbi:unnamed protein product [Rotaria sordida]|uniref:ADP ribosyltransferase domain-containing protein n=1 Tax=Rotaria sordida TaxID=392033 RepID=A0A815BQ32_9BILA|nr:unnamed protein product [Rotaria sordida]CAF1552389.1 unnamed protein product [Rotaria sordida]